MRMTRWLSNFDKQAELFKTMPLFELKSKMAGDNPFIFDIKWMFNKESIEKLGYRYWRI